MKNFVTSSVVIGCLLLIAAGNTSASYTPKPASLDSAQLRSPFLAAFGSHFELVKDELKSRSRESGGGEYWLAYVKPFQAGYFALQYRYRYHDKLYSHVEREILFSVGPKGCRRGPPSSMVYGRFCLGDTVIIPVLVNNFTDHQFKLAKHQPLTDEKDWQTFAERYPDSHDQGLDKTPVANPSESLRYVGCRSHKMLHRSAGYTLQLMAEFEAVKPGRFNLLASSSPQTLKPGESPAGSLPIIVVARDAPVILIAGREEVRGYTIGHDGREYLSSTSGNNYMTNLIVLQPGDRISVNYFSVRRGREYEGAGFASRLADPAESIKPMISVHPFALDKTWEFSDWLVDYLP